MLRWGGGGLLVASINTCIRHTTHQSHQPQANHNIPYIISINVSLIFYITKMIKYGIAIKIMISADQNLRYLWCWLEQCLLGFRLDCVVNILLSAHNCRYIVHNCKFIGGSDGDPIPLSGDACQEVALTARRTLPLAARIVIVIFFIVIKTVINYSTSKFHK